MKHDRWWFLILGIYCLGCFSLSQSNLSLKGSLSPWPHPGWPDGKAAEVRLLDLSNQVIGTALLDNKGQFTLSAGNLNAGTWEPVVQALKFVQNCDFSPVQTVVGAQAFTPNFVLIEKETNQIWGNLYIRDGKKGATSEDDTLISSMILYVDRDVKISGTGTCGSGNFRGQVNTNVSLSKGWNFVIFETEPKKGSLQVTADKIHKGAFQLWPLGR